MFYIGIDIAKDDHELSIIDENGSAIGGSIKFKNTKNDCEKIIGRFNQYSINNSNCVIGMEATGHYWLSVFTYFIGLGFDVKVINPIQTNAFRKMYIRQVKNDSKDSFIIAQVMRFGEYSSSSLLNDDMMALRQLARYRVCLVDSCSVVKNQVIGVLDMVFPEYANLFSDIFGVTSKELLLKYSTPEEILKVSTTKLANFISKCSRGRFGREKAEEIKSCAENSFGIKIAIDSFSFQIKQMIEQIQHTEKQIEELDEKIKELFEKTNSVITTIPGIGDTLGAVIMGEIGDISRFEHASNLIAYAGLDAKVKQSGKFTGTNMKISKKGSPFLRRALWLAANSAYRSDPVLSKYYNSLTSRGKHHSTAIGAVARKLCNIIFAVLKSNEPYKVPVS